MRLIMILTAVALTLTNVGCATVDPLTGCQRPDSDDPALADQYRACTTRVNLERQLKENPNYLVEKAEHEKKYQQFMQWMQAAEKPGTTKEEFDYYHKPPPVQEVEDGNIVYRYQTNPPMIVVFKGGKLVTYKIDREAVGARNAERDRQAQAENDRSDREFRARQQRFMMWQAFQPARQNTNCTSTRVGNTVQTQCN